nr:MAG TPA: hypothetical protein [Caudoviricetes sp.]
MENAKRKAMEPKEWLDWMLDELDRLHKLYSYKPEGTFPCAYYLTENGIPTMQLLDSDMPLFCKAVHGIMRRKVEPNGDNYRVIYFFYYRGHKIFSYTEMTEQEVRALCN